jgi:hypothetical protein
MRRILYSLLIGTLALAVTAWGQDPDNNSHKRSQQASTSTKASTTVRTATVKSTNHVSTANMRSRNYNVNRGTVSLAVSSRNSVRSTSTAMNGKVRERNFQTRRQMRERNNVAVSRTTNLNVNRRNNVAINRERTFTNRNNNVVNRNRNVAVTNNWRGARFAGRDYAAFRDYHRQWHDRGWWTSHYNNVVFVLGGWWYWNAGYWYPAWGYAPYAYYPYDGPIYTGYAGLTPDRVIADVQLQLQRDGYYAGPIDGVLGPMTRRAIASFQADRGLAITSTIDEPTLASLSVS